MKYNRFVDIIRPDTAYLHATTPEYNSLAPHTSGPRDVPRCGALSLLQKDAALQGGIQQKPL